MQKRDFLKSLALGTLAAGALSACTKDKEAAQAKTQGKFEQILKRGTIRSGYVVYAPNFMRDPNTGKFSGIFYDLMGCRRIGLMVERRA